MKLAYLALLALIPGMAHAHTVDSAGEYRIEIGWLNAPIVSGETNALVLWVSPLEPGLDLEEQQFQDGVEGLRKTLKMQLVYKDQSITLPLTIVQDVPGMYYAAVNPTISGFYQANILGTIGDTPVNLSMHPPKVAERAHVIFPAQDMDLAAEIRALQESVDSLGGRDDNMEYVGLGAGLAGIGIAALALARSRTKQPTNGNRP